jgi:hypothetical protein
LTVSLHDPAAGGAELLRTQFAVRELPSFVLPGKEELAGQVRTDPERRTAEP